MGGFGSGNWYRWKDRKSTVEESLVLSMRDLRGRIHPHSTGTFTWTWATGNTSSVGYFLTWHDGLPVFTLHYRWANSEDVQIPIRLQTTPTQFGGERWWFTCPLVVGGTACNRRVGKVYLPPGARYFGCRRCHNLTYRSCQDAHESERLFARLDSMERRLARLSKRRHAR
jgi:hypothetical protein